MIIITNPAQVKAKQKELANEVRKIKKRLRVAGAKSYEGVALVKGKPVSIIDE